MNPAFSVVAFTLAAGAGQGLVAAIAVALLLGAPIDASFVRAALALAIVLLLVGLAASFLHLGRPARAWRAVAMWRTSWLSREVIVLPAFIALVGLWWFESGHAKSVAATATLLPLAALAGAALLWYCTAMIYACLRFIEEWSHPLTIVNFSLLGVSSGLMLASALAALAGANRVRRPHRRRPRPPATLVAWMARALALRRNAAIRHRSTLQSATGIRSPRLVQTSMGCRPGRSTPASSSIVRRSRRSARIKLAAHVLAFALPCLLAALVAAGALPPLASVVAALVQLVGSSPIAGSSSRRRSTRRTCTTRSCRDRADAVASESLAIEVEVAHALLESLCRYLGDRRNAPRCDTNTTIDGGGWSTA
jgi:DMSO reductase anchor subunit